MNRFSLWGQLAPYYVHDVDRQIMRFLILTQYYPPEIGAPQIRLAALARALKSRGHEVEVVTALPHHLIGRIYAEYQNKFYVDDCVEGITVRRTWAYAATGVKPVRLLNYFSFALTSLIALARSKRPDYIFVESPPLFLGLSGALYSAMLRVPMIFNVADLWPDSVRELGVVKNETVLTLAEHLEHWIYSKSRFVNAMTTGIRNDLLRKGVTASKLLCLPNGVDTTLFAPRVADAELVRSLGLEQTRVFLYAGTHGAAQGLETIIEAATLLREMPVRFLFVGDGPEKSRLVEKAAGLGLNNVLFLPMRPVEEMPKLFSIATASIVPLLDKELFKGARPSKMFSSLASGVPVIFCGRGESADLLNKNQAGIAVEPENSAALAQAILRPSDDEQLRNQFAANGRDLVKRDFDWDAITGRWLDELMSA